MLCYNINAPGRDAMAQQDYARSTVFGSGASRRVGAAAALAGMLWLAVAWALDWWS
jgi:hypothetical protein